MGKCALREILRLPETELVAVYGYNPDNDGKDVGELLGTGPIGVRVTTDFDTFAASKPEVVIHTPREFGDYRADDEIIRLLEAGLNVITVLTYQYPRARGQAVHERFERAAKKGGATLHGTGIDPGFMYERLAALMTGLSNDIQHIRLEEYVSSENLPDAGLLKVLGFGTSLEKIDEITPAATIAQAYLTMGMHYLADKLGVPLARIERKSHHHVAESPVSLPNGFAIEPGTVGVISYEWIGYTQAQKPMFQIQIFWYLCRALKPAAARADDYWILEVEGLPSTRLGLEIKGSIAKNLTIDPRNPAIPTYLATVMPAMQAIPVVVAAPPGVLEAEMPQFHWKPDLRA
jgi:4-hydroxy-tetrahydrodipicolinate reductase